jgi:general secretion pathway protein D
MSQGTKSRMKLLKLVAVRHVLAFGTLCVLTAAAARFEASPDRKASDDNLAASLDRVLIAQNDTEPPPPPPPPEEPMDVEPPPPPPPEEDIAPPPPPPTSGGANIPPKSPVEKTAVVNLGENGVAADSVPEGQELVNIDFPEPTDIKDIIRAVSLWTGKNVILGRDVNGKVQMISPRKVTKEEAYQAFLSALNLLGLTTVETGKVIKILPTRTAVKGNLKTFLGSTWTPMTDEMITQIVPLKYIDAKEIQTTLSRIVSSNSMIAYRPTNTLIISDSGFKVKRILDIIDLLDVQGQQPQLSIVPIKYSDAKQIADKVQEIFKAKGGDKTKAEYMTYKIMVDERTNSVIIFGPPRTIADVKALVTRFDIRVSDPTRQSTIHVRPLDYADAKKLAATLSALASGSKNKSTVRRPPISTTASTVKNGGGVGIDSAPDVAEFDDNLKITSDDASNSLLITGSRAAYDAINTIIRKLDTRKSQVYVEADILDVNVNGGFEFASSIFAGLGSEKGNKVATTWQGKGIAPVLGAQIEANKAKASNGTVNAQTSLGAVDALTQNFTIGVLSGTEVDIPGIGKVSPGALIKMLKSDGSSRELASPSILTANNEDAKFTVGDVLYYRSQTDANATTGATQGKVEKEDVDLTLELKPNISQTNYITMKVVLDASTGSISAARQLPTVNKRKLTQNVTIKNGQTVVISGLMKTSEQEVFAKIPLLGDIPIIGWLFRNSSITKNRTNLMIFLTPYIVHGADDLASIYDRKLKERDEFFRIIYGRNFEEQDFYKLLPSPKDGIYNADPYDDAERQMREARLRKMREENAAATGGQVVKSSGAGEEPAGPSSESQPVPAAGGADAASGEVGGDVMLESPVSAGGDGGGDMGGAEPPPPPEPAGDIPPPEPPPMPDGGE